MALHAMSFYNKVYKYEALKNCKCFTEKSENRQVTKFTILIIPHIDCCVRTKGKPDGLLIDDS